MIRKRSATYTRQCLAGIAGLSIAISGTALAKAPEIENAPKNMRHEMPHEGTVFGHGQKKVRRDLHSAVQHEPARRETVARNEPPSKRPKQPGSWTPSQDQACPNDGRPIDLSGWKLSSKGGVSYKNPKDQRYWFEVTGIMRLDETIFSGATQDRRLDTVRNGRFDREEERFPSGSNIRVMELYVESGLGEDWLSMLTVTIAPGNVGLNDSHRVLLGDTYVGYTGFAPNIEVDIGRHSGGWFGLDNSSSHSWNPFLERSLQANAFYMLDGLGVVGDIWWKHGQITVLATQADQGQRIIRRGTDEFLSKNERWKGLVRMTFAPDVCKGSVWHFGVSGGYKGFSPFFKGRTFAEEGFRVYPGGRARNTPRLLDTGDIVARNTRQFNVEAAKQWGPFTIEGEFSEAYVRRVFPRPPVAAVTGPLPFQGAVRFRGYNAQIRYVLTGECHEYDVRDGAFGKINIAGPYGAFEVAARYDFLNLNDKDVRGGSQHNVTLGLNWFITQEVRWSFNYVRANIRQADQLAQGFLPRYIDIYGMRFQVRFK